jgi:hypothetical protein
MTAMNKSTAMSKHQTVVEIVRVYEQAKADIEAGFALVARAEKALNDTFENDHWSTLQVRGRYDGRGINFNSPQDAMLQLKRDVWARLVDRLELRRMMSNSRWEALQKELEHGEMPEITVANVMAFGENMMRQLPEMANEAVQEVFEFLRPRRSEYKTNSELEIGEKVIIEYGCSPAWSGGKFDVHHYKSQKFTVMENVFQMLDGRGAINRNHRSELETAIRVSMNGRGQTIYFEFKCFKKGTLHLKFRRLDLLKRFNEIAGGMRLRPTGKPAVA